MTSTIAILGTGRVGTTTAYSLILQNIAAEILLVDINTKRCEGEQIDLSDTLNFSQTSVISQACYKDLMRADIIIITAGFAQKDAHESRDELAQKNISVIRDICTQLPPLKKNCCILVVTNPVDILTRITMDLLPNYPRNQIFGSGTWLDTQRLRRIIGREFSVNPQSVSVSVIGEHGDKQVILWETAQIGGIPITHWGITEEQKKNMAAETKNCAYDIIAKKDATFFGIASCIADICSTIIFDQKRILPISWSQSKTIAAYSIPTILGARGIEQQILPKLSKCESDALNQSKTHLETLWLNIYEEKNHRPLPE